MGSQASKRDREMKKKGNRHVSHHKRSTWKRAVQWRKNVTTRKEVTYNGRHNQTEVSVASGYGEV